MKSVLKTAVLLAAGGGTRRLPITRAIDKAMLPIGNRPVIDYVIEQCAAGGIEHIICVVADQDTLIKKYYGNSIDVKAEYPSLNRDGTITIEYIVQDIPKYGYGTAPGLACVEKIFDDEAFVLVLGDGFIYGSRQPIIKSLVDGYMNDLGSAGSMTGLTMPDTEVTQYSLVEHTAEHRLSDLIEKPVITPIGEPVLGNMSYYVLSRDIFPIMKNLKPHNNEYYLTDAVLDLAHQKGVTVVPVDGVYLDAGTQEKWLKANQQIIDRA